MRTRILLQTATSNGNDEVYDDIDAVDGDEGDEEYFGYSNPNEEQQDEELEINKNQSQFDSQSHKKNSQSRGSTPKVTNRSDTTNGERRELFIIEGFSTIDESQISKFLLIQGYNEKEIEKQCNEYFGKLDECFVKSMPSKWEQIAALLELADKEILITFRDNTSKNIKGLAIISIKGQKAELVHMSTLKRGDFSTALSLVCEYAKNNSVLKTLIFTIMHIQAEIDGKVKVKIDPFLKESIGQVGFAWQSLVNREDGRRATVYDYRGPKEAFESSSKTIVRLNTAKLQPSKIAFNHLIVAADVLPDLEHFRQCKAVDLTLSKGCL